jgi:Ca2+/Na+ antiporter
MILGWLRLVAMSLVVLTVVYFLVSVYSRSVRREKLEERFDAGGVDGDRTAYIEAGMRDYEQGLRKKLIWLVYVIPLAAMTATVWWVNWD